MNAERFHREGGKARAVFCLVLIAALVCSVFAINGFAAGARTTGYDVKVDSCTTHTAALSGGSLYVWGSNSGGQFPNCDLTYSVDPALVAEDVADVAVSDNRTLVVYKNGDLWSYGCDPLGSSGAKKIASGAAKVACSNTFAMYLTATGDVMAWGENANGQLGVSSVGDRTSPVRVMGGVKKIAAGIDYALAVTEEGVLYGWGANNSLQLGIQENSGLIPEKFAEPVQVAGNVKDVDAGGSYTCILKEDGSLYTCGLNSLSQTGTYSFSTYTPMTRILEDVKVAGISAGESHGFAVDESGNIYRWGYGLSGQLGTGGDQRIVGATLARELNFVQVFAGVDTSFGVAADGSIWSWGDNTNRQLCTASGVNSLEPVKVLNADMSWAFSEQDVPDDAQHGGNTGTDGEDTEKAPSLVNVPFINGDGTGTFRPDGTATRAEFLKMVVVALTDFSEDEDYGKSTFTDLEEGRWYVPYLAYAQKNGLADGFADGTFRPNDKITRDQAAKIAAIAMKLPLTATTSSFTDVKGWAVPYVEALSGKGIVGGDGNGHFAPKGLIKRSEAAKLIAALAFDPNTDESKALLAKAENPFTDVPAGKWYTPYVLYAAGQLETPEETEK